MNNEILLSIAIPTYNRASFLENLLNNILPQVKESKERLEVCISDNNSTDNTREVVMKFKEKYPDLIKYNKNEKNLGVDGNILLVLGMCEGDFIWTFGDDDSVKAGGLNTVINFVKNSCNKDTGLAVLRVESYAIDKKTGQKIIYTNTLDKTKPEIFKIDKKDIVGLTYPAIAFISVLIFNNKVLKEMMAEDRALIEQGIGTSHIHIFLIVLLFLKYPYINGIAFNKDVVCQEMPRYKFFIEDKFMLHYQVQKRFNHLLMSNKYMNNNYALLIAKRDRGLIQEFITDMIGMKVFKSFNYFSYSGCLKLFFKSSKFLDALIFSFIFSALILTPSIFLIILYKSLLMFKYGKNWKLRWNSTNDLYSIISGGLRRRNEQPDY
ncbi:MAG: glycosyltransferase family 2 protein [Candidatus Staskawiczbacteria bacterium]|nr:glycosyltransferase family 2 protein [Candidatus Staskawiczbacteria bacterium]